ncbi:MAG TPA: FHA domain-containing protein [Rhodocyclaceae bacterium]
MASKLILSMDGLVLKEIAIAKDRMTIGRKPHNDIQIDNLAISGEHAVLVTIGVDSFLEDMNSTNGTVVNGQQIKKHFLQNGDVIELGKYKLKYIVEKPAYSEPVSTVPADFEKTMLIRPEAAKAVSGAAKGVAPPPPAAAAAGPGELGVIQLLSGPNSGKQLELAKALTTLGKPGQQVAVITRRPQGYFITHVEGPSFPVVNGNPIDTQPRALKPNDLIELAGVKMEFYLKG